MQLDYVRIALSLAVSIGIGVVVIYFMSRVGFSRNKPGPRGQHAQIVEVQRLGNKTSLVTVRFADTDILMVIGPTFASVAASRPTSPIHSLPAQGADRDVEIHS